MTMTFWFWDEFAGSTAQLWTESTGLPVLVSQQTVPATTSRVEFPLDPVAPFALRVLHAGSTQLRSGLRGPLPAEIGSDPSTFTTHYSVLRPDPITFSPEALQEMLADADADGDDGDDDVPFQVDSVTVTVLSGQLMATGTGTYRPLGLPVNFTYLFVIAPSVHPYDQARLLKVETTSASITSSIGGLGWLVNWLITLLIGFFHASVVQQIETRVQEEIDTTVQEALDATGVPPGVGITVEDVHIHPVSGIRVTASAAVPLAVGCAGEVTTGSVRRRPPEQLRLLRGLRDELLRGTPRGDAYVAAFERFNGELLQLLLADHGLLAAADRALEQVVRELGTEPARAVLSGTTVRSVQQVMAQASRRASSELRVVIDNLMPEVALFERRPVAQVLRLRDADPDHERRP